MTFTKEQLQNLIEFNSSDSDGQANAESWEVHKLARMALAGMEAEHKDKAPELSLVIYHFRDWNEGFPVERFKADYVISWMLANYPPAPQPLTTSERAELENYRNAQQVVPDEVMPGGLVYSSALPKFESNDSDKVVGYHCFISGDTRTVDSQEQAYSDAKSVVSACRAAMLQAGNSPVTPDDVLRMDWLVSKTVDVREPMVYGSHSIFWSQTITDEDDDYHATKLREQIDAAMAAEQAAPQQEVK